MLRSASPSNWCVYQFRHLGISQNTSPEKLTLIFWDVNALIDKEVDEARIQFLVLGLILKNGKRLFDGQSLLIRPVFGHQGIINIGDRHDLAFEGNLIALQLAGVASTVDLFMVSKCNLRNLMKVFGPWN